MGDFYQLMEKQCHRWVWRAGTPQKHVHLGCFELNVLRSLSQLHVPLLFDEAHYTLARLLGSTLARIVITPSVTGTLDTAGRDENLKALTKFVALGGD